MNNLDLYKIMQLHPSSDGDMINYAYKKLCKKYHPDININTNDIMQKINYAYEVLSNEKSRASYDRTYSYFKNSTNIFEKEQLSKAAENLNDYFKALITNNYKKAYNLISNSDKLNITYEDFEDWQKTVSKFYRIKDYSISLLDNFYNKKISSKKYEHTAEFKINIVEKDLASKDEKKEVATKFLVKEREGWKVYLGYKKLNEYTKELKLFNNLVAGNSKNFQAYSNANFSKLLEKEIYRKERYNSSYSLVLFEITNYEDLKLEIDDSINNYLEVVFTELETLYRFIDEFARYKDDKFFLLLPETKEEEIYPVIDKTRTFFVSQRPFPLKLDYVKVNNLNFSAFKIINLALAELILNKRS